MIFQNETAALSLAALVIAVFELEEAQVGQFMLSRPLVMGPVMGMAFHQVELGSLLGALVEMFNLEALPVGANIPPNAVISAGAALLFALGPAPLAIELALPAGLFMGWLYRDVEAWTRRRRSALCRETAENLNMGALITKGILIQTLATAAFLLAALWLMKPLMREAWAWAPSSAREGLHAGFILAPWVGAAALAKSLWIK